MLVFLCFGGSINLHLHGIFRIYRIDLSQYEWRRHLISPFCFWHISWAVHKFQLTEDVFHISLIQSHSIDLTYFEKTEFHRIYVLHSKTSTVKWRERFISFTELTLSLGAYCHTMWWNNSLTFRVLHISTETKNAFFFQDGQTMVWLLFAAASRNNFLIGLRNELPVATSLWKLHQLP